jgi:hypothetical protein
MHRFKGRLNYANVMSTVAIFLAIAGGSTAIAVTVNASKKSDINKKGKIRAGRVTTAKLANGAVTAAKLGAIDVVQASNPVGIASAVCPSGGRLIGGGANVAGGANLTGSAPEGNGWRAVANTGGTTTAYALCLR